MLDEFDCVSVISKKLSKFLDNQKATKQIKKNKILLGLGFLLSLICIHDWKFQNSSASAVSVPILYHFSKVVQAETVFMVVEWDQQEPKEL